MGECIARRTRGAEVNERATAMRDLVAELTAAMPELRGRLIANQRNGGYHLVSRRRSGGGDVLAGRRRRPELFPFPLPAEIPVTVVGVGSNLLVRDGGIEGVVIRLARGFNETSVEGNLIRAGTAVPDVRLAQVAAEAGLAGLAFYRGVPGSVGGALRMNAGAYQRETKDVLVEARAVDRQGKVHVLQNADFKFSYRHSELPADWIATQATFRGEPGDKAAIRAEMDKITEAREATQPIKSRTGGSTFKNPPGQEVLAVDRCRRLPRAHGRRRAGFRTALQFSHQSRQATAADIETSRRGSAQAREGEFGCRTRMGNRADRQGKGILRWPQRNTSRS
jgi:UDP-N-acetylmuramate dehydrogenase